MSKEDNFDFNTKKILGLIDGIDIVNKFGVSNDVDTGDSNRDIWDRSHNLNYLTTATKLYLTSDNSNDNQQILIVCMNEDGIYETFKINLQGYTEINIGNDALFLNCIRIFNNDTTKTVGNVYVSTGNTLNGIPPDNNIQAWFSIISQQTLMTHFRIPSNYYGLLKVINIAIKNEKNILETNADIKLFMRDFGKTWLNKGNIALSSRGSSFQTIVSTGGRFLNSMSDIKFTVEGVGRNDTKITCNYTIELYRKDIMNIPTQLIKD